MSSRYVEGTDVLGAAMPKAVKVVRPRSKDKLSTVQREERQPLSKGQRPILAKPLLPKEPQGGAVQPGIVSKPPISAADQAAIDRAKQAAERAIAIGKRAVAAGKVVLGKKAIAAGEAGLAAVAKARGK